MSFKMTLIWKKYFNKRYLLPLPHGKFNIYEKGNSSLVLCCLHGAGFTALSFASFAQEITSIMDCQVIAPDLRGHGKTITVNDDDLSLYTLTMDVMELIKILAKDKALVLIGHHLGGIIAMEVARMNKNVACLCLLDILEASVPVCLNSLKKLIQQKPQEFTDVNFAIVWYLNAARASNYEAAELSLLGQLLVNEKYYALEEFEETRCIGDSVNDQNLTQLLTKFKNVRQPLKQKEDIEEAIYTWITSSSSIEKHWKSWFFNVSEKFLDVQQPKLLVLPNLHHLDSMLTIAQLKKKFDIKSLPVSGVVIIEEQASNIAKTISDYLKKQNIVQKSESPKQKPIRSKNRVFSVFGFK